MRVLTTQHRTAEQVAFSADNRRIFAIGSIPIRLKAPPPDCGIAVLDIVGNDTPNELLADMPVHAIAVNPAGRWLYANTEPPGRFPLLVALDLSSGAVHSMKFHGSKYSSVQVSACGKQLAADGSPTERHRTMIRCWRQPAESPPEGNWDLPYPIRRSLGGPVFSPDGDYLLVTEANHGKDRLTIALSARSSSRGAALRRSYPFPGFQRPDHVAFMPDGSRFAAVSGMSLYLYDAASPKKVPLKRTNDNRLHFTDMAFHPSGRYLAATSNDATVKLYDTESWQVAKTFTWNVGRLRSIAFSPDGTLAAIGSDTGKIVVWDVDL